MKDEIKKEFTIEELEAQYKQAEESQRALREKIERKKKEENELKEKKLALEKATRKKEVDDAVDKCKKLIKAYMHDYSVYSFKSTDDDDIFSSKFWNWIW